MSTYQGLGAYSRQRPDPSARRPGESEIAWQRRRETFYRQATVEDQDWADHRAAVDQHIGSGSGLFQNVTPQERAAALGSPHAGAGEQRVQPQGHLVWEANAKQPGVRRLYAQDVGESAPGVSPLMAYLRGNTSSTDERCS
jgi:hypothetical protein